MAESAWTPYEPQKMEMEGLAAVSLVVREGETEAHVQQGGVWQRVMAGGVIVNIDTAGESSHQGDDTRPTTAICSKLIY